MSIDGRYSEKDTLKKNGFFMLTNDFIKWIWHIELWKACIFVSVLMFWIILMINVCAHFMGLIIGIFHGVIFTIRYVCSKEFREKIKGLK